VRAAALAEHLGEQVDQRARFRPTLAVYRGLVADSAELGQIRFSVQAEIRQRQKTWRLPQPLRIGVCAIEVVARLV
jgi:hypothetical protein